MKKLKIFIIITEQQENSFKFSMFEGMNVESLILINQEDMEENITQLLHCNLIVNCTVDTSTIIHQSLSVGRMLNREIIHISRLSDYVKK